MLILILALLNKEKQHLRDTYKDLKQQEEALQKIKDGKSLIKAYTLSSTSLFSQFTQLSNTLKHCSFTFDTVPMKKNKELSFNTLSIPVRKSQKNNGRQHLPGSWRGNGKTIHMWRNLHCACNYLWGNWGWSWGWTWGTRWIDIHLGNGNIHSEISYGVSETTFHNQFRSLNKNCVYEMNLTLKVQKNLKQYSVITCLHLHRDLRVCILAH